MKKLILLAISVLSLPAFSAGKFFANNDLQMQTPLAFTLQPQSHEFVKSSFELTISHADKLLSKIAENKALTSAINSWQDLTIEQQIPHLRAIFELECAALNISAPKLLIDTESYPDKTVFFDFNVNKPDSGIVYLNPEKLKAMDKYASLAFLLHETRHSYQFQLGFERANNALSDSYRQAFKLQKQLKPGTMSFSDFLTLANEYEAFLFGNYVVGKLTNWQIEQTSMGTYASQFDSQGKLKIDLKSLHEHDKEQSVLERYNQLAKEQKLRLNR